MTVIPASSRAHLAWGDAIVSVLGVVLVGTGLGLVTGLALVHVLALLGMNLETGTGHILEQVFPW